MPTLTTDAIATKVYNLVDDITEDNFDRFALVDILDQKRNFINNYLGVSIASASIEEKYQGPLINLTISSSFFKYKFSFIKL